MSKFTPTFPYPEESLMLPIYIIEKLGLCAVMKDLEADHLNCARNGQHGGVVNLNQTSNYHTEAGFL